MQILNVNTYFSVLLRMTQKCSLAVEPHEKHHGCIFVLWVLVTDNKRIKEHCQFDHTEIAELNEQKEHRTFSFLVRSAQTAINLYDRMRRFAWRGWGNLKISQAGKGILRTKHKNKNHTKSSVPACPEHLAICRTRTATHLWNCSAAEQMPNATTHAMIAASVVGRRRCAARRTVLRGWRCSDAGGGTWRAPFIPQLAGNHSVKFWLVQPLARLSYSEN